MSITLPEPVDPDAYREFLRCWDVYLRRVGRDREFTGRLADRLEPGAVVRRWPTVWPEVDWLFETRRGNGMRNFVSAVREAEGGAS